MHDAPQAPKPAPFSPKNFPWRLRGIALLILVGFVAVLVRLFYIQIIRGADLREKARKQYEAKIELRAERGKILDRNGTIIAETIQSASFAADPKMLEHPDEITTLLSQCSGISREALNAKIAAARSRNFVWLARGLNVNSVGLLDSINDVGFIRLSEPRRNYVHGSMAAQLIGCTDVDNRGLAGIELALDSLLRGQSGIAMMQRDGRGRMRPGVNNILQPAQHGHNVQLTMDAELQQIVEHELRIGIEKAKAVSGTAIALDPKTGEVLALASFPVYDPNAMGVQRSPEAMRLRAITDMYEPGSTFKLVTSAIAVEQGQVTPETIVDGLNGELRFSDGSVITDHEPMSTVTLTEALEKSSNIVFAKLAHSQSNATLYRYTRNFGFGIPTGFDIPGEVRGILKKPNEFDRSTKLFMGFGYQLAATALQMANCYAAIANDGVLMRPYILKAITDANGTTIRETQPQTVRRVVSSATARTLRSMFTSVVIRGTGIEAGVRGLAIAGKTGTAQQLVDGKYSKQAYTASFAGFYPAQNPAMVLLVMLDRPQTDIYGGRTAAPIFRNIVQRVLMSPSLAAWHSGMPEGVIENSTDELPAQEQHSADSVAVPDVRGMDIANAGRVLHERGLRMAVQQTSGIIVGQSPSQNTTVLRGTEVTLTARYTSPSDTTPSPRSSQSSALPDVRGMTLRRALSVLHAHRIRVRIEGSGIVKKQVWLKNNTECTLRCD